MPGLRKGGFLPWPLRTSGGALALSLDKGDLVYRLFALLVAVVVAVAGLSVVPDSADATVPGAVGRIAFVSDRDTGFAGREIYVRDFAGGAWTRLTSNTAGE
jgi:hypothetical protein